MKTKLDELLEKWRGRLYHDKHIVYGQYPPLIERCEQMIAELTAIKDSLHEPVAHPQQSDDATLQQRECVPDVGPCHYCGFLIEGLSEPEEQGRPPGAPESAVKCPGCGKWMDPEVCHCGDSKEHHTNEHSFVPMGCDCGRMQPVDDGMFPKAQQPTREECLLRWMDAVTNGSATNWSTVHAAFTAYRRAIGKQP